MSARLYVTNLSAEATLATLRSCFADFGAVSGVEFAVERNGTQSSAYVTMSNAAAAEQAERALNRTELCGRTMMVSVVLGRAVSRAPAERRAAAVAPSYGARPESAPAAPRAMRPNATITQQYRERHNMAYELDCVGAKLTLKIFFPAAEGAEIWRIHASCRGEAQTIDISAVTRARALEQVATAWRALPGDAVPTFDWEAVTQALRSVRAL